MNNEKHDCMSALEKRLDGLDPIDLSDYWAKSPLEQARMRAKVVERQKCFACPRRAVSMVLVNHYYEYVCSEHGKTRKR